MYGMLLGPPLYLYPPPRIRPQDNRGVFFSYTRLGGPLAEIEFKWLSATEISFAFPE